MNTRAAEPLNAPLSWAAICDLAAKGQFDGFHVDTDEWGRILMTPVTWSHGALAARLVQLLGEQLSGGHVVVEVGVRTRKGVKAPDVMWTSHERAGKRKSEFDDPLAGEICIEVLSAANHPKEIEEKRQLYFEQGKRSLDL
jgi:Uma2 family endonuclease